MLPPRKINAINRGEVSRKSGADLDVTYQPQSICAKDWSEKSHPRKKSNPGRESNIQGNLKELKRIEHQWNKGTEKEEQGMKNKFVNLKVRGSA